MNLTNLTLWDGVILFDKSQKNELDPYPTCNIHIQKMRLTKVNEIPHPFDIRDHGIELIGSRALKEKSYAILYLPTMQNQNILLL